jgi:hypothetical protein
VVLYTTVDIGMDRLHALDLTQPPQCTLNRGCSLSISYLKKTILVQSLYISVADHLVSYANYSETMYNTYQATKIVKKFLNSHLLH